MKLPAEEKARLDKLCNQFRIDLIETLHQRQTGHPGGSLSVCEILTTLYFEEMNVDPADPQMADRDRLVLCKGHAAPMLYRVLAEKGFFPVDEMKTLRCLDSRLQGHPCPLETPGVDAATGPLGIGLSAALGMSMALKLNNSPARVYAILGDGEIEEGTVWEALMAAVKYKADNLCWTGMACSWTAPPPTSCPWPTSPTGSSPSAGTSSSVTATTWTPCTPPLRRPRPSRVSLPSSWPTP